MKADVINFNDFKVGSSIPLDTSVFGLEARADILHRMSNYSRAKNRGGNRSTKTRSQVSGTTKKPHSQKGTGKARLGSLRATQCVGGGTTKGPVVRDHSHKLTKKFRKLALKHALSSKLSNKELQIIDEAKCSSPKTKDLQKIISKFYDRSVLVIYNGDLDSNFEKAYTNLKGVDVLPQVGANVLDILGHEKVLITKEAVSVLEERLKK